MEMNQRNLLKNWVLNFTLGEFIGISAAAIIVFIGSKYLFEESSALYIFILMCSYLMAGLVEGTVVGYFQSKTLSLKIPNLDKRKWILYTAASACFCWFIGALMSISFSSNDVNVETPNHFLINIIISLLFGAILGFIFGGFQYFVIKRYVTNAFSWIISNMIAWAIAITIINFFASIPSSTSEMITIIMLGSIAGILAGLTAGLITGFTLINLNNE